MWGENIGKYIFFFLLAKLKPYDYVGPKGTVELLQLTVCTRERKASISGAERKERNIMHVFCDHSTNIETRPSNVHIHSTEITYVVHRHIDCMVRLAKKLIQYG